VKKLAFFSVILGVFVGQHRAQAGFDFSGGDPVAIDFENSAQIAIGEVQGDISDYPQMKGVDLSQTISNAKVMVSDDPLYVESNGVQQESTAVNSAATDTIIVNRAMWNAIQTPEIKNALALHEVLSLASVESTGNYQVSSRYLYLRGLQCAADLCAESSIDLGPYTFEKAKVAFASGTVPQQKILMSGLWDVLAVADFPTSLSSAPPEYDPNGFLECNGTEKVSIAFTQLTGPFNGDPVFTLNYGYFNFVSSSSDSTIGAEDTYDVTTGTTGIHFATSGTVLPQAVSPSSQNGYFDYECRALGADKMLCAGIYSLPYFGITEGQVVRYLLFGLRSGEPGTPEYNGSSQY
jgi:hypothetical protein